MRGFSAEKRGKSLHSFLCVTIMRTRKYLCKDHRTCRSNTGGNHMVTLSRGGAWLLNGTEIVEEGQEAALQAKLGAVPSKEEAAQQTIAYGI